MDGVAAILLTLKKRPVIRFSQTSETAQRIANDVRRLTYEQVSVVSSPVIAVLKLSVGGWVV